MSCQDDRSTAFFIAAVCFVSFVLGANAERARRPQHGIAVEASDR